MRCPLRDRFGDIARGEILSTPEVGQKRGKSERKAKARSRRSQVPSVSEL